MFISIIIIVFLILLIFQLDNKNIILDEEDKNELLSILEINNAPSFKFISIDKVDFGFGNNTQCYTLNFEISVDDYNKNNLNYQDGESAEVACKYKVMKDEKTYICSEREWEYCVEERKPIYQEILKLNSKYYGIKAFKILANILENK